MPQSINLIEVSQANAEDEHNNTLMYILVAYKSKCELISEKYGECLRQFQFNRPTATISSIVELYDENGQRPELLVTYNCKLFREKFLTRIFI